MINKVEYCSVCNGKYTSDEDVMFGTCCNTKLLVRNKTKEELESFARARAVILEQAKKLRW